MAGRPRGQRSRQDERYLTSRPHTTPRQRRILLLACSVRRRQRCRRPSGQRPSPALPDRTYGCQTYIQHTLKTQIQPTTTVITNSKRFKPCISVYDNIVHYRQEVRRAAFCLQQAMPRSTSWREYGETQKYLEK